MKEIKINILRLREIMTYARKVSTDMARRRRESNPGLDVAIAAFLTQLHDLVSLDGSVIVVDQKLSPLKPACEMYDTCPLQTCGKHRAPDKSKAKRRLTIPNE